jgi:hypothetical protein
MRVLGSIVQALVLPMLDTRHHDPFRSGIAGQFIGDHHARCLALLLEQLAQQVLRRLGIATTLDQNVENGPVLIDGAPEPMLSARDADHDLVEVPFVSRCGKSAVDLAGKALAELQGPLPHRFMTDLDASGGQHLLDHRQAQGKPKVQPDGITDHFSREAVASVARRTGVLHPSPMPPSGHSPVNLTVPNWVLSGSIVGWGDAMIPTFNLVVFLYVPGEVRLARLRAREQERFGSAVEPNGSMYEQHQAFLQSAAGYDTSTSGRTLETDATWLAQLNCPVMSMTGECSTCDQVSHILSF